MGYDYHIHPILGVVLTSHIYIASGREFDRQKPIISVHRANIFSLVCPRATWVGVGMIWVDGGMRVSMFRVTGNVPSVTQSSCYLL